MTRRAFDPISDYAIVWSDEIVGEATTPEEQYRENQGYQSEGRDPSDPLHEFEWRMWVLEKIAIHAHGARRDVRRVFPTEADLYRFIQLPEAYRRGSGNFGAIMRPCPTCKARAGHPCIYNLTSTGWTRHRNHNRIIGTPHKERHYRQKGWDK